MQVRLVGTAGPHQGQEYELSDGRHLLGRAPECAVCLLGDQGISHLHANLLVRPRSVLLTDEGSRNGTYLNEIKVAAPTVLAEGDTVRLGASEWLIHLDATVTGEPEPEPAPRLQVLTGDRAGEVVPLVDGTRLTVGRGKAADLTVGDPFASRVHAAFSRTGEAVTVTDLGSSNGVEVNGERTGETTLAGGDVIALGRTRLRYLDPHDEPGEVPAEDEEEEAVESVGRFGPYLLLREMGRGGMGRVFVAQRRGDPLVALKVLRTKGVGEKRLQVRRHRFEREAAVLHRIDHDNVVRFLDAGHGGGLPYLVMELVEGPDLGTLLHAGERLPYHEIERLLFQLCAAVKAVHEAGIVHRDIKPANIILHGPQRMVKLADFGIARRLEDRDLEGDAEALRAMAGSATITDHGKHPGTPLYMSPEQTSGQQLDMRSDIWALGVILYQLVAGRRPFEGDTAKEVMQAVRTACPPPLPDDVPPYVRSVVYRCLLKPPHWRFASAAALMDALHERRVDQPVPVGVDGPPLVLLRQCPFCDHPLPAGRESCTRCRTDLSEYVSGHKLHVELQGRFTTACGTCGAKLQKTDKVCERCGKEFGGQRTAAQSLHDESLTPEEAEALSVGLLKLKACPYCGTAVDAATAQCSRCGLHLRAHLVGRIEVRGEGPAHEALCGNCEVLLRDPSTVVCARCGLNFVTGRLRGGKQWHSRNLARRRRQKR